MPELGSSDVGTRKENAEVGCRLELGRPETRQRKLFFILEIRIQLALTDLLCRVLQGEMCHGKSCCHFPQSILSILNVR